MSFASLILSLVTLQRLGELVLAQTNTRNLKARGAIEVGAAHYPLIVGVHAAWLITLWAVGRDQAVNLPALAVFVVLQDYISSMTVNWMSFVGSIFVLVVLFFPRGLLGMRRIRRSV